MLARRIDHTAVFVSDLDSWSPYGKADMLERVALAGYRRGRIVADNGTIRLPSLAA
jgi:hypothetical protein